MKMKRIILWVLPVAIAVALTGCTNEEEGANASGSSSSAANQSKSSSMGNQTSEMGSGSEMSSGDGQLPVVNPDPSAPIEASSQTQGMYTLSQLEALPNKLTGWGPGPNKDGERPEGATAVQPTYEKYDAYFIAPDTKKVYITFDEGYENGYTPAILDTLKEKNVSGVFFVTYDFASNNPELVHRMIDEGHIVGNHSHKHPSFPTVSAQRMLDEITFLHEYIKENFQYEMKYFRFPKGEYSDRALAAVQSLGYKSVFWSFAYKDWDTNNQIGAESAFSTISKHAHNGAIYLLHAVSKDNAQILGRVIDDIRSKGYEIAKFDL